MLDAVPVSRGASRLRSERVSAPLQAVDPWLLGAGLMLLALGLLMVASASMPIADRQTGQPFYFLIRQGAYVGIALILAFAAFKLPLKTWFRAAPILFVMAVILLSLVLVVGREVNGSHRWITLGPINVQVSEPAKLFAIVYLAAYLQRHGEALQSAGMAMIRPMLLLAVVALLLLLEPDFGAAAVLLATALGMMFLAGVSIWRFAALQSLCLVVMTALLVFSPYRWLRLTSFWDAWDDPYGTDFQLIQSLIAIGRGELFGVGLGASIQKLFYLPEAYTDFLFAILAEELGLLGVVVVMGLYVIIVWRAFRIGALAEWLEWRFAAFLAYGIGLWFGIQALINMGVNMGVLPTKGLTLPLMSYGGSSMVVMCVTLGVLLRIDWETRVADPRRQRKGVCAGEAAR